MNSGMVIIGAGEAGGCAAVAMREAGWGGAITIIGDERHLPYERPPLSKSAITADTLPDVRTSAEAKRFEELRIKHISDTRVAKIDRALKQVHIQDGGTISYQKLMLATGAQARPLLIKGGEYALTLRSQEDVWALRRFFEPGRRVLIIGGGLIGLELAASANQLGATATIFEGQDRLLARSVQPDIASRIERTHLEHGNQIRLSTGVDSVERTAVILETGERIDGDVVVAAIGAQPDIMLAGEAGLAVDKAILTNEYLQTSDPDIFACGDCAATLHPLFPVGPQRLESWQVARDQGSLGGRNMVLPPEPQNAVPWFWSDQFDRQLQVAGVPLAGEIVVERNLDADTTLYFYLMKDGTLVGAAACGQMRLLAKDMRISQRLIAKSARPDTALLAAPDSRLKTLLAA